MNFPPSPLHPDQHKAPPFPKSHIVNRLVCITFTETVFFVRLDLKFTFKCVLYYAAGVSDTLAARRLARKQRIRLDVCLIMNCFLSVLESYAQQIKPSSTY